LNENYIRIGLKCKVIYKFKEMNRKFSYLTTAFLLLIGIAVFVASCNEEDPEPEMVATQIELVSGNIQPAMVGAALANPIEVV